MLEEPAFQSEQNLRADKHLVELIITQFRVVPAKIRPGVDVIEHELQVVAPDVVIHAASDGLDVVMRGLAWIETFPFRDELKFFTRQKITSLHIITVCDELIRLDRKSTRLNSSHIQKSRMPSSA